MTIRAIIFDMDGLLVNSEPIWQRVEREMIVAYGGDFDEARAIEQIGMAIPEAAAYLVAAFGLDISPAAFADELVARVLTLFIREAEPMAGAAELMEEALASPLPVAVASSAQRRVVEAMMGKFGWLDRLDLIVTGDDVPRGKPAPDIFLLTAERLGVSPAHCLVLEDSLNGARAAQAAGMRCVAVPNPVYKGSEFDGIATHRVPTLKGMTLSTLLAVAGGAPLPTAEPYRATK